MKHFGDELVDAVRRKRTAAMVGLDPRADLLPEELTRRHELGPGAAPRLWARAVEEFCSRVLDVTAPAVPAVKVQSAFFEMHGPHGMEALYRVIAKARRIGLIVILDAKRGDIGSTSQAYAEAAFGRFVVSAGGTMDREQALGAHAVTVNPYMGRDSLEPFLKYARDRDRGLFVLVRTSNPGSADLQQLAEAPIGRPVWSRVAEWVRDWSEATRGRSGYGSIGAVVGGTAGAQIAELRAAMPNALLLIPGYGAQGATAADIAAAFDARGLGALVNSSRAILFPPRSAAKQGDVASRPWEEDVATALAVMIDDLAKHTAVGKLSSESDEAGHPA